MNLKAVRQLSHSILFGLVVIVAYLACISQIAWAQSDQPIEFTKEFKFKKTDIRLPFGKKILISGAVEPLVTSLTVYWIVNSNEANTKANIKNGGWTAIVGPFPAGQSVIFRFEIISTLSEKERADIKKQVQNALNSFVNKVFSEKVDMTPEEFKAYTEPKLMEVMPPELKKFMSPTGKSFYDIITKEILSLDTKKLLDKVINKIADRNSASKDIIKNIKSIKEDFLDKKEFMDVLKKFSQEEKERLEDAKMNPKNIPQDINKMKILSDAVDKSDLESQKKEKLKNILLDLNVRQNDLRNINEELDELINDITDKVSLKIDESAQIAQTTAEVSDLEYYAGFDVAELIVPNEAVVSSFFTINIYTKRMEVDLSPKSFLDRFSLTTGIGLTTSGIKSDGPVYYLGAGYRFNRYFRITAGGTFFKKVNKQKFKCDLTLGFSLNFRLFGDLLKIFNSILSSTPGQAK
jgi:hypothetical protein